MKELRRRILSTALLLLSAAGCADGTLSPTGPTGVSADILSLPFGPPQTSNNCNGGWGQLSARPFSVPDRIPQLERVVVYGSPVQRPYRGYGDHSTYGGVTNVYTYDRNVLNECSFGTDRTFEVQGPVEPEASAEPLPLRAGVDTALWNQLTEAERVSLDKLADLLTPMSFADVVMRSFRVAQTFNKVAEVYTRARSAAPLERLPTQMVKRFRSVDGELNEMQRLRVDAFTTGCNLIAGYARLDPTWPIGELADHARRTMAAWAARQANVMGDRRISNELANLASLGVEVGQQYDECGRAAGNHFEQRFQDLIPPGTGDGDFGTLF